MESRPPNFCAPSGTRDFAYDFLLPLECSSNFTLVSSNANEIMWRAVDVRPGVYAVQYQTYAAFEGIAVANRCHPNTDVVRCCGLALY